MTREQAREEINTRITELPKAKKRVGGHDTYICPFCDNGSGADGDGISSKDGIHYKCFKCGYSGDYLDILKTRDNLTEREVFERYNLTIDGGSSASTSRPSAPRPATKPAPVPKKEAEQIDYTDFFLQAKEALQKSPEGLQYLQGRGISSETAYKCGLGYAPEWRSPAALRQGKNPPSSARIIIPTSEFSYMARALGNGNLDKMKEGGVQPFNIRALYGDAPVFITEADLDAVSIIEVGGVACSLGSASMVQSFLRRCKDKPPTAPLILSLDNDDTGRKAQAELKEGLEALKITAYEAATTGEHKDQNEYLQADRDAFAAAINDGLELVKAEAEAEREKYINETSVTAHIDDFVKGIKKNVDTPAIPTKFTELDMVLDDGLYEGLYIVGAISSLGKTSLVLQIADQIAQQGQDVLIFSLEMSKMELMAKSISRITYETADDKNIKGESRKAKTTRGITASKKHINYSNEEKALINDSINKYATYTDHLYIYEGIGNIGAEQIRQTAEKHIKATRNKPVIVIDYLQILAPHDIRATDKQATDKNVFDLKRLSRDFRLPVIGISSLNRANYNTDISMTAFKESGAIEYSSDVLIGLQFEAMSEDEKDITEKNINKWKRDLKRKIELKILKNRNGVTGDSIIFDYYPMFNYFHETGKKAIEGSPSEPAGAVRGKAGRSR